MEITLPSTESVSAVGDERATGAIAGLGADHRLPAEIRVAELTAVSDFALTILYRDVAGKCWQTTASYLAEDRRYVDISVIEALDQPKSAARLT